MPQQTKYLIVGGGLAGASATRAIRKRDRDGRLVLVSAEEALPYHRPPLSKEYLKGEAERDQLLVQREGWYEKYGVETLLGRRATELDADARTVRLSDGEVLEYERCLLATGGRARRLDLPGGDLDGIHTLRHVADSEAIRAGIEAGERAVVVGASFIGMEVASACAEAGVETTVLELGERVWPALTDENLSNFFRGYFEQRGVRFRLGDAPSAFEGDDRVRGVRTREGERIDCDFVVVGIGIELNLDYLSGSDVAVDNGVMVDERLRTSADGLYAAGDIAAYPDPVFDRRLRIEHWDAAKSQGDLAGHNMAGADETYDHMSYFFSDVFDLSFNFVGEAEFDRVLVRGSTDDASFVALYVEDGVLNAALLVNREWSEMETARELIRARTSVDDAGRWSDPELPLGELG